MLAAGVVDSAHPFVYAYQLEFTQGLLHGLQ